MLCANHRFFISVSAEAFVPEMAEIVDNILTLSARQKKHFIDILLVISDYFCYNSQRSFMDILKGSNRRSIMANKLSEQIYGSILKDIVSGVYAPREFISEAQIAAKYGVSKAPVKEAMHILASEGFLLSYPKRGYMVNVYTTDEINNIQEVRRALETLAMRKAIVTATDEELNALRFYQESEEMQCRPGETVNTRFHMGIARLAKNKALEETLYPLLVKASAYNIMGAPDVQNFDRIVDAMLARDEELAVECLLKDVRFL